MRFTLPLLLLGCAALAGAPSPTPGPPALPAGFVALADVAPALPTDLRYAGPNNFIGALVDGYDAPRAILTAAAAAALRRAHDDLAAQGYGLKLLDAYRPQRAVAHFIRWSRAPEDAATRRRHHPDVPRAALFARGYLALESSHSRGSAVDVTLVRLLPEGGWQELDLGTPFDFFGPEAHHDHPGLTAAQRAHRELLRATLERHGFEAYPQEWWHYTLRDEPYPETYFDFPIR